MEGRVRERPAEEGWVPVLGQAPLQHSPADMACQTGQHSQDFVESLCQLTSSHLDCDPFPTKDVFQDFFQKSPKNVRKFGCTVASWFAFKGVTLLADGVHEQEWHNVNQLHFTQPSLHTCK